MAMSLGQGGSGFLYMSQCVYNYLCGVDTLAIPVGIHDTADFELRNAVQEVCFIWEGEGKG